MFWLVAADGIRCREVTGIQTCALPILPAPAVGVYVTPQLAEFVVGVPRVQLMLLKLPALPLGPLRVKLTVPERSEERRVGKEGSSRVPMVEEFSGRVVGE